MVEKSKWKPLEWLSSRQRVSGSNAASPERGGIKTKQNQPQTLESEVLISTVLSFKSPPWPLEKVGGLRECVWAWRMLTGLENVHGFL